MKTRVIQDSPSPASTRARRDLASPRLQTAMNVAGRMGRWSATHRKRAIWGWLGLVFALLVLIMGAQVVKQKDISTVDSFSGESQQAERALTDAGLRPNEEVAMIQSEDLTATDPEFERLVDADAPPS